MADTHESAGVTEKTMEARRSLAGRLWRQHLRSATVDGVTYFLEGNGSFTSEHP
jgi:hypothetical protein